MAKKAEKPATAPEIKLKDMTADELKNKAAELAGKIALARLEKAAGKAKNMRLVFNLRRERAKVLTVLNIKKMS